MANGSSRLFQQAINEATGRRPQRRSLMEIEQPIQNNFQEGDIIFMDNEFYGFVNNFLQRINIEPSNIGSSIRNYQLVSKGNNNENKIYPLMVDRIKKTVSTRINNKKVTLFVESNDNRLHGINSIGEEIVFPASTAIVPNRNQQRSKQIILSEPPDLNQLVIDPTDALLGDFNRIKVSRRPRTRISTDERNRLEAEYLVSSDRERQLRLEEIEEENQENRELKRIKLSFGKKTIKARIKSKKKNLLNKLNKLEKALKRF
jgi:hypothetical protein